MTQKPKPSGNIKSPSQAAKPAVAASAPKPAVTIKKGDFAFQKENYRIMFVGLAFIILGFILMIGGGSKDPNVFNPAIFDFQRLTLAPILIIGGYVIEIVAIMKKPKD